MNPEQRAALNLLLSRHSVGPKHLHAPAPTDDELLLLAEAALRAPDHGKLTPFHLVALRGPDLERLADLFEDYGRRVGKSGPELDLERTRATQAPLVIAVVAHIDPTRDGIPAHEQWACVGGGVTNVMNALHFLGYAGKMLSGARVADPVIARAFCAPNEQLLGWISAGTPTAAPKPRQSPDPRSLFRSFVR